MLEYILIEVSHHLVRAEIAQPLHIGRGPDNKLTSNDSRMSRNHGSIFQKDGKLYYGDYSSNGTVYIRKGTSHIIHNETIPLQVNDELVIGEWQLILRYMN